MQICVNPEGTPPINSNIHLQHEMLFRKMKVSFYHFFFLQKSSIKSNLEKLS